MATLTDPLTVPCPICDALRGLDQQLLALPGRGPAMAGALCEAMGLCEQHAALLSAYTPPDTLARLLDGANTCALDLLSGGRRNAERLQALVFGAEHACPLCRYRDHQLAQAVHHLIRDGMPSAVCAEHYPAVIKALQLPSLQAFVSAQHLHWELLGTCVNADEAPQLLDDVLAWVAVPRRVEAPPSNTHCPVCAEIEQAELRWRSAVHRFAGLTADQWMVFPLCAEHVGRCVHAREPALAQAVARHAIATQSHALREAMLAIEHDNEQRRLASASVFYRHQSAAYILGRQRRMALHAPRCPACERMAVAQAHGVGALVDALRSSARDGVAEQAEGLCMKHFAAVYLDVADEARTVLAKMVSESIQQLRLTRPSGVTGSDAVWRDNALGMWRSAMPAMLG